MLNKEFNFFLDNQPELVSKYGDKFLIIVGNEVKNVYKTRSKAYREGKKKFGLGNFLIQHCLPGELATTATFHSLYNFF